MLTRKILINSAIVSFLLINSNSVFATEDLSMDSTNKPVTSDMEDLGVYVLSKVVDYETKKPLADVKVSSDFGEVLTDQNGEFLLKVKKDGYIVVNKDTYKETFITISDMKGKIVLQKIPDYLDIFPLATASINYKNLGFSDTFDQITATGRFNDGFTLDASYRLFDMFVFGAEYQLLKAKIMKPQTQVLDVTDELVTIGGESADLTSNMISLNASYLLKIIPDRLESTFGLKGYLNNISISNQENLNEDQDNPRPDDYLDFNNQRIGIGAIVNIGARPLRYEPIVLNAKIAYYPFIGVSQPEEGLLPGNLSGFEYSIGARYDLWGGFAQIKYLGKNVFQGNYSSGISGVSIGVGYGF